ncbi:MAG: hypothetical protein V5A24_00505 [Haloarculaceae archaeon]
MTNLDWELATAGEVTLVHAAVRSEVRQSVQIVNELSGPVWPPRTQGRPVAGWSDGGYAGVVEPGSPLVVGYASPAPPEEPPVSLETAPPLEDGLAATTPAAVVRALGTAAPPRAAVPQIGSAGLHPATEGDRDGPGSPGPFGADQGSPTNGFEGKPPAAVTAWLDDVATSVTGAATTDEGDARVASDRRAVAAALERCEDLLDRIDDLPGPKQPPERVR